MRRSVHIAIAATSVLVVMSACKGRPVRSIVGRRDTGIIGSDEPIALAARGNDAAVRGVQPTPEVMELVLGDSARRLPVAVLGLDSQPVTLIAESTTIGDTNIATLDGRLVRARAPGSTVVQVKAGENVTRVGVIVYERVRTLDSLRPQQRNVIVSVRLANGESRRWRLAGGTYFLAIIPNSQAHHAPQLATIGTNCMPTVGERHYICLGQDDASLIVYNPADSRQVASADVALQRLTKP